MTRIERIALIQSAKSRQIRVSAFYSNGLNGYTGDKESQAKTPGGNTFAPMLLCAFASLRDRKLVPVESMAMTDIRFP
jgi:hypothetical protein